MNTVEALKELYKSFGGKLTDTYSNIADGIPVGNYSVIPDCFAALAEIAGGSIELPVVTQADAGDVLTVGEDGKWKNAEPAKELPSVTASDNGSVLGVVDGAWAKKQLIKKVSVSGNVSIKNGRSYIYVTDQSLDTSKPIIIGCMITNETTASVMGYGVGQIIYSDSYTKQSLIEVLKYTMNGIEAVDNGASITMDVYYIEQ